LGPECLTSEPLNQSSSSPLSLYLLYKSEPFPLFFSLFLSSLINQLLSLLIIILLNVCKSLFSSTSDQSQNEVFIHYLPFYSSRRRSFCSKLKAQSICHYQWLVCSFWLCFQHSHILINLQSEWCQHYKSFISSNRYLPHGRLAHRRPVPSDRRWCCWCHIPRYGRAPSSDFNL
jgi:hypothetical protein